MEIPFRTGDAIDRALVSAQDVVPFSGFHKIRPNAVLTDVAVAIVRLFRRPIEVTHFVAVWEFPDAFFVIIISLKQIICPVVVKD